MAVLAMRNDKDTTHVGKAVRVARAARGISQKALAERLGVSANYLSLIENGKRQPSLSLLQRVGRELEVPPAYLLMDRPEVSARMTPEFRERVDRVLQLLSELLELPPAHRVSTQRRHRKSER